MLTGIAVRLLEGMFVVGVLGSAVVVLLTAVEDFKMLFSKDKAK
jgi:hypothetical protein